MHCTHSAAEGENAYLACIISTDVPQYFRDPANTITTPIITREICSQDRGDSGTIAVEHTYTHVLELSFVCLPLASSASTYILWSFSIDWSPFLGACFKRLQTFVFFPDFILHFCFWLRVPSFIRSPGSKRKPNKYFLSSCYSHFTKWVFLYSICNTTRILDQSRSTGLVVIVIPILYSLLIIDQKLHNFLALSILFSFSLLESTSTLCARRCRRKTNRSFFQVSSAHWSCC